MKPYFISNQHAAVPLDGILVRKLVNSGGMLQKKQISLQRRDLQLKITVVISYYMGMKQYSMPVRE